ncbi:MAG: capsular polysaccharide biosynthesis protein CapF [Eubacteriales bacterium]|nr:capsular polysaccharide biosynthesis protein CapF [Eubacteriales bacterium]MDD4422338.1 capsular polysaccharide biosynthesis protein CapF [Eubacteriales bacterium]HBR32000.1 capsular biosynthesis protein [Clostridiales bacterium]
MKILITGAKGFIGKNLKAELCCRKYNDIFEYDLDTDPDSLDAFCREADFVFHLAGVNRPKEQSEYMTGNFGFTSILLDTLRKNNNKCPIMISSSTQAANDNPYGQSKKAGEKLIFDYGKETGAKVFVYRFPNVFGKWCRPNYNSAVATFCNNIASGLPIMVNDRNTVLNLVYIDDVVQELVNALEGRANICPDNYCSIPVFYTKTLGEIVDLIYSFKASREERSVPDLSDDFTRKLYATYLSYLPKDCFSYPLKMNKDNRGSFTEIIKTTDRGQFSVNISKPGIVKGNHWHNTKNEKFVVVSGRGVIRLRRVDSEEILEYYVNGRELVVVDIPTGYTHNIENLGENDMVTFMWASETFDPDKPDTIFLEV